MRPTVAALGGGHGLAASLSALRLMTDSLTAIVTVADDGGSSGCCPPGTFEWHWRRCVMTPSGEPRGVT